MNDDEKRLWDDIVRNLVTNDAGKAALVANAVIEARRAFFGNGVESLTGPKKPTKPLVEPRCECGHLVSEHIQIENGKGWLHCDGSLRLYL